MAAYSFLRPAALKLDGKITFRLEGNASDPAHERRSDPRMCALLASRRRSPQWEIAPADAAVVTAPCRVLRQLRPDELERVDGLLLTIHRPSGT
jgi:hypothetical protein